MTLPRSSHDQAQGPEAGVCDLLSGLLGEEARSKRGRRLMEGLGYHTVFTWRPGVQVLLELSG